MAKRNENNLVPILLIGAGVFFLFKGIGSSLINIPNNLTVGSTKIRSFKISLPNLLIGYDMEIINFNNFPLPVNGLLGFLYYQGREIGQVSFQQPITIPAFGRATLPLQIQASLLSLGLDVYDKLTNQSSFKGALTIKGQVYSNGIGFPFERLLF